MTTDNLKHVVFSGGGTGGHLFPGLAVAECLVRSEPTTKITFVGSGRPLERRLVAAAGFGYQAISCRPLMLRPDRLLSFMTAHVRAAAQARAWLAAQQPDVVVGLGGFASIPLARAAIKARVPLVLLEQNAVAGKANRWLARYASLVCLAFEEAGASLPRSRGSVLVTGNPIRPGICASARRRQPLLLILGGSGGSRQLNHALPQILGLASRELAGWQIVHQAGPVEAAATRQRYAQAGISAKALDFIDDMPGMLANAGLVISRCGGTTLAELAAASVPAIACPWAGAAHGHQRRNAQVFERRGACRVWQPEHLDDARHHQLLVRSLAELLADDPQLARMSQAMRSLARPQAAGQIAEHIHAVACKRGVSPRG